VKRFFDRQFPDNSWYTDGRDDAHNLDTIPYQVTMKWNEVAALSCSPARNKGRIYFEKCYFTSAYARHLYRKDYILDSLDYFIEDGMHNYAGDMAYTLDALFSHTPPKLEHIALRSCLWNQVNLAEVPWALEKAAKGFFDYSDPDISHLTSEGKEIFKKWREEAAIWEEREALEAQEEEREVSTHGHLEHIADGYSESEEEEESKTDCTGVESDEGEEEMDKSKDIGIILGAVSSELKIDNNEVDSDEEGKPTTDDTDLDDDCRVEEIKDGKEIEIENDKENLSEVETVVCKDAKELTKTTKQKSEQVCSSFCENRRKYTGILTVWKGSYGFIQPDVYSGGMSNIFIHISELSRPRPWNWIAPGMRLEYSVEMDTSRNKPKAVSAKVLMFRNGQQEKYVLF